ncbi:MAG: leucyl aminopeptidase [Alphaproteobacteria bacterium]|nr:MAG: leucyl aminopeptidase [Alphaproteobacteria bacterium]
MKVSFSKPRLPKSGAYVVFALPGNKLAASAESLDKILDGAIRRAIKGAGFKGERGETVDLFGANGLEADRVVVVGLGRASELDPTKVERVGAGVAKHLLTSGLKAITVVVDDVPGLKLSPEDFAAHFALGFRLRSYRFDRYRTKEPESKKPSVKKLVMLTDVPGKAEVAYAPLDAVADGVALARDLLNEPGNVIYPESYAKEIQKLEQLGVRVEVLDEKAMRKLGMNALLAVGQGSANESKLVIMEWNGARDSKDVPLAFIGKGVTFDSGGISLKPGAGMDEMKYDMGGSAAVVGLMRALAGRKARVNVVGVVGLVENMPSHKAQRPGDIIRSMSGQTIEVLNTDAEGRLVLADALWYTQDRYKPRFMIDLATLTGAIIIALGHEYAGLFSNNETLAKRLEAAGQATDELVWRMPLSNAFDKDIDSKVADMKNIGNGREAGSIAAAQFLQRFVNKTPWAHLDIAGTAWGKKDRTLVGPGPYGYGVRLLDRFIADYYEEK